MMQHDKTDGSYLVMIGPYRQELDTVTPLPVAVQDGSDHKVSFFYNSRKWLVAYLHGMWISGIYQQTELLKPLADGSLILH